MTRQELADFFEDACHLQHDQFYPERHAKNLTGPGREFSSLPEIIIDCLSRFFIHLDTVTTRFAADIRDGQLSQTEALGALKVTAYPRGGGTKTAE